MNGAREGMRGRRRRRRDIWKMGGKWQLQSVQSMHKFLHVRKVAAAFQNFSTLLPFESFEWNICCTSQMPSDIFASLSSVCVCESVNYAVKYAHTRTHTHTEGETCCSLIQFIKWKLCFWFTLQVCSLEDLNVRQIVSVSAYIHYVCICTHIHIHMCMRMWVTHNATSLAAALLQFQ